MDEAYNFDLVLDAGKSYEAKVSTFNLYGYFEHNTLGDNCGGGLWFERLTDGRLSLTDYDGVFALPKDVIDGLEKANILVDEDFK